VPSTRPCDLPSTCEQAAAHERLVSETRISRAGRAVGSWCRRSWAGCVGGPGRGRDRRPGCCARCPSGARRCRGRLPVAGLDSAIGDSSRHWAATRHLVAISRQAPVSDTACRNVATGCGRARLRPCSVGEEREWFDAVAGSGTTGGVPLALLVVGHRPARVTVLGQERVEVDQGCDEAPQV